MTVQTKTTLKGYFNVGDKPTETQFSDLIDTLLISNTDQDITVGSGRTLDVSAGTLTLADNQISGNKVDGGTISNFASTGIDDNAAATTLTIDSSARFLIGTTTSSNNQSSFQSTVQINGVGTAGSLAIFRNTSVGAGGGLLSLCANRGATAASHTVLQADDGLGSVNFAGSDGTNYIQGALISSNVDGTPGTNDMPTRLVFATTADGGSAPTERMRITSAGLVGIGKTPTTTLDVSGTIGCTLLVVSAANNVIPTIQTTTASAAGIALNQSSLAAWQVGVGVGDGTANFNIYSALSGTTGVRFMVTNAGSIVLGTQVALATNATVGHVYIPNGAGTPTGAPTAYTGKTAMYYDTSANKIWFYNGSWRGVVVT